MTAATTLTAAAALGRQIETEDDRVVVARPKRTDLIEVRHVGIEPAVLEAHRLDGVDVPDIRPDTA